MIRLYDYYRSSASYRVRIALNLKGLDYERVDINLLDGRQKSDEYRARNPQGLVPLLEINGAQLTQSLSIVNYLNGVYPDPPLAPADPIAAAHVRSMAQVVASDIHPLNNLRVLNYVTDVLGHDKESRARWYAHWVHEGFEALEQLALRHGGEYLSGDLPGLADLCLVPQIYNARRFEIALDAYPTLVAYDAKANALDAFQAAHPDKIG
ncbi:maleylacetoacetate isomerase [Parasphingopyxis sp.]|uniref:maleylacetoacetate isomerase n=1 Tax=Parasphingopyxis sp. TaxID=1920299 RepID=UPI0026092D0F|nr:maleylacetoacetate isomerase [Parasphingopyxis sp.]